jgi:hypothetical protein
MKEALQLIDDRIEGLQILADALRDSNVRQDNARFHDCNIERNFLETLKASLMHVSEEEKYVELTTELEEKIIEDSLYAKAKKECKYEKDIPRMVDVFRCQSKDILKIAFQKLRIIYRKS